VDCSELATTVPLQVQKATIQLPVSLLPVAVTTASSCHYCQ